MILKKWISYTLLGGMVLLLTACQGANARKNAAVDPTIVTIWHYYNGAQKEAFDKRVTVFNETEGMAQGIVVEAISKGNIGELMKAIEASRKEEVGSEKLPDVFSAYSDTAYDFDQKGLLADLAPYMTAAEIESYEEAYMKEGQFDATGGIKLFPIAKATEVFSINQTDWEPFAAETGYSEQDFTTWESLTKVAQAYYEWTDAQTETPYDGKAFYGRDAFANYMLVGSLQLGHEIYRMQDEKTVLDFDRPTMQRLWNQYYMPYINGYYASYGRFRSDDVKTGDLLAFTGSSSGTAYFPDTLTLEDGTAYPIRGKIYPLPNFSGTEPFAVQQGAGMAVMKSEAVQEAAAVSFLKWFTEEEGKMEFSAVTGYLPVKKTEIQFENMDAYLKGNSDFPEIAKEGIQVGMQMVRDYQLYTPAPTPQGSEIRHILEISMPQKAKEDREKVLELIANGKTREEAVEIISAGQFDLWYEAVHQQLL
ncbi:MAG: extracellular solute-binding protein, partial [Hungatella sp.]